MQEQKDFVTFDKSSIITIILFSTSIEVSRNQVGTIDNIYKLFKINGLLLLLGAIKFIGK